MATSGCCQSLIACVLKFLNFLQTFTGVSIVLYSIWMLNRWSHYVPVPSAPPPEALAPVPSDSHLATASYHITPLNIAVNLLAGGVDGALELHLPPPWFIYIFMGTGILLCCVTCIGHIAAEAVNGCCLCFYILLTTMLMLLEGACVAYVAIDRKWEKDVPFDPTGEIETLHSFIKENADICTWIGISFVVIQAMSLLLALILRSMVSTHKADYESDDDYAVVRGRTWEPLLNPQSGQTSGSAKGDVKGSHSDIWSSRMRGKYGLNAVGEAKV